MTASSGTIRPSIKLSGWQGEPQSARWRHSALVPLVAERDQFELLERAVGAAVHAQAPIHVTVRSTGRHTPAVLPDSDRAGLGPLDVPPLAGPRLTQFGAKPTTPLSISSDSWRGVRVLPAVAWGTAPPREIPQPWLPHASPRIEICEGMWGKGTLGALIATRCHHVGGASMSFVKAPLSGLGWFGVAGAMRRARRPSVFGIRRRCRRGAWRTGR